MEKYFEKHLFSKPQIETPIRADAGIVIVIPCFAEKHLINTLQSLKNCILPNCSAEVIIVINSGENTKEEILNINEKTYTEAVQWIGKNGTEKIKFYLIRVDNLPAKHAGVGLARKIGMDEAAGRFETINNSDGIIVCFDADCTCEINYLVEIEKHFLLHPRSPACSIYFEHPIKGNDFSDEVYEGIIRYELFLRYYIQGLRYAQYPFAYHTIGSSMAVRSEVYQKQGGMNKRKAGEDFYFLHKIIPLGNFSEINSTKVIASPRPSSRVPFGTGRSIQKWLDNETKIYKVYHPQIFMDLKIFIETIPLLYTTDFSTVAEKLPDPVKQFLKENNIEVKIKEVKENAGSQLQFIKRFYNWLDGFRMLKYIHFARDKFYGEIEITEAANLLLEMKGSSHASDLKELLMLFRDLDKGM